VWWLGWGGGGGQVREDGFTGPLLWEDKGKNRKRPGHGLGSKGNLGGGRRLEDGAAVGRLCHLSFSGGGSKEMNGK